MDTHSSPWTKLWTGAFVLITALALSSQALASLTLTSDGVNAGFTLSTFATLNPGYADSFAYGPFGVAVAPNGNIIVSNYADNTRYVFSDVDGQTTGTALFSTASGSGVQAYATAGGHAYGTNGSQYVEFNNDGTANHVLTGVTPSPYLGMWGNPVNGHVIATSYSGLIDIDPLANGGTGSYSLIASVYGDGVSVSPDGKTAYLEAGGQIIGYDIATGTQTFASGFPSGGWSPDGTGVITSNNSLNGDIVVNDNYGRVFLVDPGTNAFTLIADGGTRGDYVSPDTNNGSLFMDFSDIVARLSCGPNCSIGGPPPPPPSTTPEPSSLILLGSGGIGLLGVIRRKWLA